MRKLNYYSVYLDDYQVKYVRQTNLVQNIYKYFALIICEFIIEKM